MLVAGSSTCRKAPIRSAVPSRAAITTGNNNSNGFGTPVYIRGAGRWATTISYYGSGDCLRIYGTEYPYGGGITDLTIDGTNASAGAVGLHMGDIFRYEVGLAVTNFSGAGSIGAHFDNQYFWTEQLHGKIFTDNCTQQVVFDNSANVSGGATGSFYRAVLDIFVNDVGNQDCVAFRNSAVIADGNIGIYGNSAKTAGTNTAAVLRMGTNCGIYNGTLNIGVELGGSGNAPQTINFSSGSGIQGCNGIIDFTQNLAFTTSNIATHGTFTFYGEIFGDATLSGLYDTLWCITQSTYTLTSTTSVQKLFGAIGSAGAVTITAGIWWFECDFEITGMSATSGNLKFDVLGAGTATLNGGSFGARGLDSTTPGTAAALGGSYTYDSNVSGGNIVTAATGTGLWAHISGFVSTTTAGTLIPSVGLTTAAAAVVQDSAWFRISPVTDNTGLTNSSGWS